MAQFAIDEVLTTGIQISGFIFDYSNRLGTAGQVLTSTTSGVMWQADSSIVDLSSLSGQIAATGTLLNNRINSLSGYSNATFATITNLAATGSALDTKINILSGYSNANFATITNLAATGSVLDTKINTLSGYSNANFATITNLAATGSVLDTKINTLSGYSNSTFATVVNLAATGSTLNTKINTLSGYANNTFLSGVGVANYIPRWNTSKELVTGSIYDIGTAVGIGTTSPAAKLQISKIGDNGSNGLVDYGIVTVSSGYDTQATLGAETIGDGYSNLNLGSNMAGVRTFWHISKRLSSSTSPHALQYFYYNGSTFNELFTFATGGSLGIGSNNPAAKLDIRQSSATTALKVFTNDTSTAYIAQFIGYDNVLGDTTRMVIQAGGSVGIGTLTPASRLAVEGGSISTVNATGTDVKLSFDVRALVGGAVGFNNAAATNVYGVATGLAYLGVAQAYPLVFTTNGTERLRIAAGGNVGIGSTNPAYKLDVNGSAGFTNGITVNADSSSTSYFVGANGTRPIIFQNNTASAYDFGFKFTDLNTFTLVGGNTLANPTTDLVSFTYDGKVGIGLTAPTSKLHVVETTATGTRIQLGVLSSSTLMNAGSTNDLLILNVPYGDNPAGASNIGAKWGIKFIGSTDALSNSLGKTSAIYAVSEDSLGYNRGTSLAFYTNQLNDQTYAERMRIYHNGNVGIGTTSPAALLSVGSSGSTSAASGLAFGNDTSANLYRSAASTIKTDGSLVVNGNFNTNTTTVTTLNINAGTLPGIPAGSTITGFTYAVNNGNVSQINLVETRFATGSDWTTASTRIQKRTDVTNQAYIEFNPSGASYGMALGVGANSNVEALRILSNGNVGIGTISPVTKLHIEQIQNAESLITLRNNRQDLGDVPIFGISAQNNITDVAKISFYRGGGGNAGYLAFSTKFDNASSLTEKFRIDGAGNVGIGTTNPLRKLHITSSDNQLIFISGSTAGTWMDFQSSTSNLWSAGADGTNGFAIFNRTTNANAVTVANGGNIGIGTTNPSTILTIAKAIDAAAYGSGTRAIDFKIYYPGFDTNTVKASIYAGVSAQGTLETTKGYLAFLTSATAGTQNLTEKLRIEADGNVGIGTTNPVNKLDVIGGNNTRINLGNINDVNRGGKLEIISGSDTVKRFYVGTNSSVYNLSFGIDSIEKAIIDLNGNFGIGTASPTTLLSVGGAGSASAASGLTFGGDASANLYRSATSTIKTNGSLDVAVNATFAGNVGIGLTTPAFKLDVSGGNARFSDYIIVGEDLAYPSNVNNAYLGYSSSVAYGPQSNLELIDALSNAIGVNDPLRFKTTISGQYFSGSNWYTDPSPLPYRDLLNGNANSYLNLVTSSEYSVGISGKRFVVDLGDYYRRPNFILLNTDWNQAFWGFKLNVENSNDLINWTTSISEQTFTTDNTRGTIALSIANSIQSNGVSRYFRFSFVANQAIAAGALVINKIRSFGNQNYSSYIPVSTSSTGHLIASVGIISPTITSLSGNLATTGSTLDSKINSLSGYSNANFATILNLAVTGSTLDTKINTLSGYSNANFATILNLAATGSTLDTKINTTNTNLAATGSTLDTKINTTNTNLAATGSTLNARINSLSGYAGSTFLSGQGVANWTARWNGTKELITGSIYDLGTGIGIGTTSPTSRLTVVQSAGTDSVLLDLQSNNDPGIRFGRPTYGSLIRHISATVDYIAFNCNGTSLPSVAATAQVVIDENGNVGVGTTAPNAEIHVLAADAATADLARFQQASQGNLLIQSQQGNQSLGGSNGILFSNSLGRIGFRTNASVGDAQVIINANGNVGINTTNPSSRLHIIQTSSNNALLLDSDSSSIYSTLEFNVSGVLKGQVFADSSDNSLFVRTNTLTGALKFGAANSERMRIDTSGNVGINTTNPIAKFVVNGGTVNTATYTSSQARIADGSLHLMKTAAGGIFESIRAMNMDTTAGTTVRVLAASTSDPFNNANGGKVFIDAIRTATNMDLAFSLNDVAGAAAVERVRFMGNGNVGIGSTNPAYKLDVTNSITSRSAFNSPRFSSAGAYVYGATNSPTWNIGNGSFTNNNATAPDGTTSAGTYTLSATSALLFDLYQTVSGLTNGRVYTVGMWVKLGTATNFCLVVNNTQAWNTIGGKAFTSNDGLSTSKWTHISYTFTATVTGAINIHLGYNLETGVTQQTAGTVFLWNIEMTEFSSTWIGNVEDEIRLPGSSIWTSRGNVGIGTTNPTATYGKLSVAGGIRILDDNNAKLELGRYSAGASNSYIKLGSNSNSLRIANNTDAADIFTIENGGNVGIGTVSPATLLSVGGAGSTSAASGLTFGADASANLYRSAAGTLKTDGRLNIVGDASDSTPDLFFNGAGGFGSAGGQVRAWSPNNTTLSWYWDNTQFTYNNFPLRIVDGSSNILVYFSATANSYVNGGNLGVGTSTPSGKLHVVSTVAGATVLRADGTNGTLFSVVDDLSDSLMSVNNSAGLPVLEVFADDRVVAGQYGSGDFVLVNNKVGIGTSNPINKLSVVGNVSIGSNSYNISAPTNGLIVEGNVGIGTTSPDGKLSVLQSNTYSSFRSNGAGAYTYLSVGRTASELEMGVAGGFNQFFIGTAAGESIIKSLAGKMHLGYASNAPAITINTSNYVGLGTTNPVWSLDVSGTAIRSFASGGIEPGFIADYASSNGYGGFFVHADGTRKWRIAVVGDTNASPALSVWQEGVGARMSFRNNGNVGVGTTLPDNKLSIGVASDSALGTSSDGLKITDGTRNVQLLRNGTGYNYAGVVGSGSMLYSYDRMHIVADTANPILFHTAGAERVRIGPDGNVGIGVTNPTNTLQVNGQIAIKGNESADNVKIHIQASDNSNRYTIKTDLDGTTTDDLLIFRSNTVDNMLVLKGNGNVGIGATNPATKLEVYGVLRVSESASGGILQLTAGASIIDIASTFYGGSRRPITFTMDSEKVRIAADGKFGIGINAPTTLLSVGPVGSTLPASGLTFGGDASANLYRSAASTIKTDGNLVVAGATSFNNHKYDSKTVTLTTASYTTVLTISLTAHTSCYVKIGAFGDWSNHSAVAFVSELFIQNGDNAGYGEPGTIITAHDNTRGAAGDKIDIQIVDPAAAGTQNFLIQLKLISATLSTYSSLITYHVMGQQVSVT